MDNVDLCVYNKINRHTNILAETIFYNFYYLAADPDLKHNINEINRILDCVDVQFYVCIIDGHIESYLLGEIINLLDGRTVIYITYIYTSDKYRKNGLASKLIEKAITIATDKNIDGIMLTCDTEDKNIVQFYGSRGFNLDLKLRRYTKYDVFFLRL